jgi:hypothetical protein
MTQRQPLTDRRPAETFDIEVAGLRYTCIAIDAIAEGQP